MKNMKKGIDESQATTDSDYIYAGFTSQKGMRLNVKVQIMGNYTTDFMKQMMLDNHNCEGKKQIEVKVERKALFKLNSTSELGNQVDKMTFYSKGDK